MTLAEYAAHRGNALRTVEKARDGRRITVAEDGTVDPQVADREWKANTHTRNGGRRPGAGRKKGVVGRPRRPRDEPQGDLLTSSSTLEQAERLERIAKAERAQLEAARLRGDLLPKDRVLRNIEGWGRVWRDRLLALPTSVAEEAAAELNVTPAALIVVLEKVLREFLTDMADHTFRIAGEGGFAGRDE